MKTHNAIALTELTVFAELLNIKGSQELSSEQFWAESHTKTVDPGIA